MQANQSKCAETQLEIYSFQGFIRIHRDQLNLVLWTKKQKTNEISQNDKQKLVRITLETNKAKNPYTKLGKLIKIS